MNILQDIRDWREPTSWTNAFLTFVCMVGAVFAVVLWLVVFGAL